MIKLVFSLRRRSDLTREEFQAYWRDEHAPLVAAHADVLRIRRYVQTHARASEVAAAQSAARGSEPDAYDGEAELWWDSLDDIVAAVSTPDGQQAAVELLEDERRFIDLERSPLWIGEETVVIAGSAAAPTGPIPTTRRSALYDACPPIAAPARGGGRRRADAV